MTFGEAMERVAAGARVTKQEWGNTAIYLQAAGGFLKIFKPDAKEGKALLVSEGDLLGRDWMEI